jgi:hypothetical protein
MGVSDHHKGEYMSNSIKSTRRRLVISSALVLAGFSAAVSYAQAPPPPLSVIQAYQELFGVSQKEKRGLMFYVKGQSIGGAVTKVIGNDAVEIRNQTHGRIIIRLDQVDAVAIN